MVTPTIIADYGQPNLGKTESVKLVYEKLEKIVPVGAKKVLHAPTTPNDDIRAVLIINGVKVGISSLGDWCPEHKQWLDELVHTERCDIIVAACQHGGHTVKTIISYNPPYRIYWTCNARLYEHNTNPRVAPKGIQNRFNAQWAEEMANLIESWCYA